MTCRIAANDYVFEPFTEVEVAEFNAEQIHDFINKWFGYRYPETADDLVRGFREKLDSNMPGKEQATNPLLLTFLCLVFEEFKSFPSSRSQLYKKGIELLLYKWDSQRNIERARLYKSLDLRQKEDLLAHIAYQTFSQDKLFFARDEATARISE